MTQRFSRAIFLTVGVCTMAALGGCGAAPFSPHPGTVPSSAPTLVEMRAARDRLQVAVNLSSQHQYYDAPRPDTCEGPIEVRYGSMVCSGESGRIRFLDTPSPIARLLLSSHNLYSVTVQMVDGRTVEFLWEGDYLLNAPRFRDRALDFVDSWAVLAAGARDGGFDAAGFDRQVDAYLVANPKPELPEEARRFKVQAEDAVKRHDLEGAADKFSQALELAPWWPQGRFNLALVYAEMGLNARAVAEMQRYLRLVPNAANARAAQDKIYLWQAETAPAPGNR